MHSSWSLLVLSREAFNPRVFGFGAQGLLEVHSVPVRTVEHSHRCLSPADVQDCGSPQLKDSKHKSLKLSSSHPRFSLQSAGLRRR